MSTTSPPIIQKKKQVHQSWCVPMCLIYGTVILYVPAKPQNREKSEQFPKLWFASLGIFEDECRTKWGFFCNCFRSVPRWTTYCEQIGGLVVHDGMVTNVCGANWGSVYGFSFVSMVYIFWGFKSAKKSWVNSRWWMSTNKLIQTWCFETNKFESWINESMNLYLSNKLCFCWCCRSQAQWIHHLYASKDHQKLKSSDVWNGPHFNTLEF